MGDAKQVKAVIQSIRQYKNFRQMAEYNISCLLTYITPPTVGWRENVAAAVEDGGIASIIDVLGKHGQALDMVKQATTALSGLAISRENAGKVAEAGGIETALQCMKNLKKGPEEEMVIDSGAKLIETVARFNPESVIKAPNAVQSMLDMVGDEDIPRVQTASAKVLDRIGMIDEGLDVIVKRNGIKKLVDAIAPGKVAHEGMLKPILRLLERLTKNPEFVKMIRDCHGVEALVAQLDHHAGNEFILRAGGRLLAKIADGDIEETIRKMGMNLPDAVKQHLVGLLANLALQPENVEKIVAHGGIQALLNGFEKYNPQTKAAALRALTRIADTGVTNVNKLIEAGALAKIIDSIRNSNGDENVLEAATQALTSISAVGLDHANLVFQAGGVNAVLEAMMKYGDAEHEGFSAAGLDFIEKLTSIDFPVIQLAQSGAVEAVLSAMKNSMDNSEIQEKGFKALTGLVSSKDDKGNKFVAESIGNNANLSVLPESLYNHRDKKPVVVAGTETLAKLAAFDTIKDKIAKVGTLDALVAAAYEQMKLEMLGKGRISGDPNYVRNVKALAGVLVSKNDVLQLATLMLKEANPEKKLQVLQRTTVFSLISDFVNTMLDQKMPASLKSSLDAAIASGNDEDIVDHCVTTWALAKAGIDAMSDLNDQEVPKSILGAAKTHAKLENAVVACFRSMMGFASNLDFKSGLIALGAIESCMTGMRSNPTSPEVNEAAIDLLIALSSNDAGASQVCYKGGARQVNKMVKDSSTSPDFERPIEKAMKLLYRVSTVDKADVKDQLRKQDTVNTVTIAMSAFPTNSEVLEFGARILALLMNEQDVAQAIDDVTNLTGELIRKQPDQVFDQLGLKAATVGFLSLNPKNLSIMKEKNAKGVTNAAIKQSKKQPQTAKREAAVMNEYRALGQISSVVGSDPASIEELLKNLMAPEEITSLTEKIGILEAIKYMCNDPSTLDKFLDKNAIGITLDLLSKNRSDEKILLSALDALSALMANNKGIDMMTKAGGNDLIFNILRDDAENLKHKEAASAMIGLKKLATKEINTTKLVNDGAIDAVHSTISIQAEQSEEPRPKVVGAAAALLHQMLITSKGKDKENVADQIVKKGVIKKLMDLSQSSPEYLADGELMQDLGNLLNALTDFQDLIPKLREMGAVDLMMSAINMNPGNEDLENLGQKILQKLVGGDKNALEQTLKDYDRLLENVKRRPEGNLAALERLNRAGVNLGNLMLVEGVVDAKGAKQIVERALDTYQTVEKIKSNERIGPVREQILDTALQTIGRSNLIDGAVNEIDLNRALGLLAAAMGDYSSPQLQVQALNALAKLLNEDEKALISGVKFGIISKLDQVMTKSASPEVKEAARKAMEIVREGVMKRPEMLLEKGKDEDLAALLKQISDPKDLEELLDRLTDAPFGADALMRLALGDLGNLNSDSIKLSPELRKALLKALGHAPPGVLTIPPGMLKEIVSKLKDPTVDADEKAALLRILGEMQMNPAAAKALLDSNAIETLLDLLNDKNSDPNLVLAALNALSQMGRDPHLANQILTLNGAQSIAEVMRRLVGNKQVQEQGFITLANLKETAGPENLNLSPDALSYLEGALGDLDAGSRQRAAQLVNDLANLYNGEIEPMVVSRFDNMLEVLNAGKDWRELHDPKTGKPYYYNVVTKETTWTKPAALIAAENALANLLKLAEKRPAEIDQEKLRQAIGHFGDQSAEPLRLKALAKALAALASNEKNRDAMVKHGVLKALVDALKGKNVDREFILAAIALLNQFAKHKVYKEMICDLGGIEALIAIMLRWKSDEEIVEKCEQCLANLAYNSANCTARIMDCQGVDAVGHVLAEHTESAIVNTNGMNLLSNLMFKNADNKRIVGSKLRDRIIAVLRRHYRDQNVLMQTGRALGNIAFIDDHIRHVVRYNTVRSLIVAMEFHQGKKEVLQLGIDVIGNFASVDEDEFEQEIKEGKMVSVVSTIWHEGGAKKIVDTFGETTDPKLVASCTKCLMHLLADVDVRRKLIGMNVVPMLFSAMQKYDWDQDISDFCIDSIELLSYGYEGIQSIFENDGVSILLQQMELSMKRTEFVQTVTQTLANMANLKDMHKEVSTRVLHDLTQQGGIDTIIRTMEANVEDEKYVTTAMRLLLRIIASDSSVSHDVATKGMRIILKCVQQHEANAKVLITAYQLIGLLAFEQKNLKIIVQYGGINLIVNSILKFPENDALVKRSIQTLDNISMGSEEHSNIVKEARGEDVIRELIKTYETIPGEKSKEVVKSCKAALLSLNKIETRKLNRQLFFTEDREATDLAADPLKKYRALLKTGELLTLWKKGRSENVHLVCREKSYQINWKVPGKDKVVGKLDLKNFINVVPGKLGHGKKADAKCCFALQTTDKKNAINFECKSEQQKILWVEALEALKKVYRGNQKHWLEQ